MSSHRLRVFAILSVVLVALIGVIVLVALGVSEGTGFGALLGVLGTATTAFFDALGVERRRRNPAIPALADDVRSDGDGDRDSGGGA
jgi:hypothetical protein